MIEVHKLQRFGQHIADTMRYAIRGTSVYRNPEEACDSIERQCQEVANELRSKIHECHSLRARVAFLERQLGIKA